MKFEVDPGGKFSKAVQKSADAVGDLRVPLTLIAKSWFQSNKAIFQLKGPGKYPDLSDSHKTFKIRHLGSAYPILKLSGDLEASITDPAHGDAINVILNKNVLFLGTKNPVAKYHQGAGSRTKMPFRPMVLIGSEQTAPPSLNKRQAAWVEILRNFALQKAQMMGSKSG